jgi:hypothetical protein
MHVCSVLNCPHFIVQSKLATKFLLTLNVTEIIGVITRAHPLESPRVMSALT